jgi:hypothetical protein
MAEELAELCRRMKLSDGRSIVLVYGKIRLLIRNKRLSLVFCLNYLRLGLLMWKLLREQFDLCGLGMGVSLSEILKKICFWLCFRIEMIWNAFLFKVLGLLTRSLFSWSGLKGIFNLLLSSLPMRIRVYNLPIKSMIPEVGEDIGRGIGCYIEVDVPENGLGWGRFLRIRVEIDVTEPLLRGSILGRDEEDGGSLSGLTSNMNIYPFSATDVACWDIVVMNVLKVGEAHKRRILLEKNGVPGFGLPCLEILSLRRHRQSPPQSDDDREASEPNLADNPILVGSQPPDTVEGEAVGVHYGGEDGSPVIDPEFCGEGSYSHSSR